METNHDITRYTPEKEIENLTDITKWLANGVKISDEGTCMAEGKLDDVRDTLLDEEGVARALELDEKEVQDIVDKTQDMYDILCRIDEVVSKMALTFTTFMDDSLEFRRRKHISDQQEMN